MSSRLVPRWLTLVLALAFASQATADTLSFVGDGSVVSVYPEGGTVYLRLELDQAQTDVTTTVTVTSTFSADVESVVLTQVGNTGKVYEGSIRLDPGVPAAVDGLLQTATSAGPPFVRDSIQADTGTLQANASLVGSITRFVDVFGDETAFYAEGQDVHLVIVDHQIDDPLVQDSFFVDVELPAFPGVFETIEMTETGLDTGVFEGSGIPPFGDPAIRVVHDDADGPTSSQADATVEEALIAFVDAEGRPVTSYTEASRAYLRVTDPAFDSFIGVETLTVTLDAQLSGDSETGVILFETGQTTGIFEGSIDLAFGTAQPGDDVLQVSSNAGPPIARDTITATHALAPSAPSTSAAMAPLAAAFTDDVDADVEVYGAGARVRVRLADPKVDQSALVDQVTVNLDSDSADFEDLVLREVGFTSGIFAGTIDLESNPTFHFDGLLSAQPGDEIRSAYFDSFGVAAPAAAQVSGVGIEILDSTGRPTVELVEDGLVRIRVTAAGFNTTETSIDSIGVSLGTVAGGDVEGCDLEETGPDSGVFVGKIALASGPATPGNDTLEAAYPDHVFVTASTLEPAAVARTVGSRLTFVDPMGEETAEIPEFARLRLRLEAPNLDTPGVVDQTSVTLRGLTGLDEETAVMTETGPSTGIFEGLVLGELFLGFPNDGYLSGTAGERIEAVHVNADGTSTAATARLVPLVLTFLDENGEPTDSTLQGGPAVVRVWSPIDNYSPSDRDQIGVNLRSVLLADDEFAMLTETGVDSGVFEGSIATAFHFTSATISNGVLEVSESLGPPFQADVIEAELFSLTQSVVARSGTETARVTFIDAFGQERDRYAPGETMYVRVEDHRGQVPGSVETVVVTIEAAFDTEDLTLVEVGASSGVFEGSIPTSSQFGGSFDGEVQGEPSTALRAVYEVAEAAAVFADSHIGFVDAAGLATAVVAEGGVARLRVIDPARGNPSVVDTLTVDLATFAADDTETVTLVETAAASDIYEGSIPLSSPFSSGAGVLDVGAAPEEITATYVDAGKLKSRATAHTVGSQIAFLDAFGNETTTYTLGETVFVRVVDGNLNDPGQVDSFLVTVDSPESFDSETVTLTETGLATGVFEGSIPLTASFGSSGDGELTAELGELLAATHQNGSGVGSSTATALVVSSSILFIDAAGEPAEVYLESTRAFVRVLDPAADTTGSPDTLSVSLAAGVSFDSESLTLTETGAASGIFEGSIPLAITPASPGNGVLETSQLSGPPHSFDSLSATYTDAASLTSSDTASTLGSRTFFIDAFGNQVESYAIGSTVYLRVEDHNADDPALFDSVSATVTTEGGDSETATLVETAKASGVFEGSLPYASGGVAPDNGTLELFLFEQIEAVHDDALGLSQSKDQAMTARSSVEFIDEDGVPTAEVLESDYARVRVVDTDANVSSTEIDSTFLNLSTFYAGDAETVTLIETGEDTAVFEGSIRLAGPWTGFGAGVLDTSNSGDPEYLPEVITATYDAAIPVITATAATVGSRVEFVDEFGRVTSTYPDGGQVIGRVADQNRNDPGTIDTFVLTFEAPASSDFENVTFTETGFDTGVFEASIALGPGTGELAAAVGDTVQLTNFNLNDPHPVTATATIVGSAIDFVDENGELATAYMESTRAYVRLVDAAANVNAGSQDSVAVDLSAELSFDFESLTLLETGPDTGIFEGSIPLSIDPASPQDGTLQTSVFAGPPLELETIRASWTDATSATVSAEATTFGSLTTFVDAFGNEVESYATGDSVYLRIEDQNANQLGIWDTVLVTVSSLTTGDSEVVTLGEVEKSGGVFAGSIELQDSAVPAADGTLQAVDGETIEAVHDDALGVTQSKDQATIERVSIVFVDAAGVPTSVVLESDWARLRVISHPDNFDPGQVDNVFLTVRTFYAGDAEGLTLVETGADTGVFEGSIRLAGPWTGFGPGVLETSSSGSPEWLPEVITAEYDVVIPAITATAATVGSRVDFVDEFGRVTSTYPDGGRVIGRVADQNRNDPGTIDTFVLTFEAPATSDFESVTFTETGFDTGVFVASIDLGPGAGELAAAVGDTVQLSNFNLNDPIPVTATATIVGSAIAFVDEDGELVTSYLEGTRAFVRLTDAAADTSGASPDSVAVDLSAELSFDFESLTLVETGPDTGIFEGSIPLSIDPASPQDGTLQTSIFAGPPLELETIRATWTDAGGLTVTAEASTFGSSTAFIDAFGNEVESYGTGDTVYVRVEDQNANQLGIWDTVLATVSSLTTGDSEVITLGEVAKSSGIFEGSIALQDSGVPAADGTLQAVDGEIVEATHDDSLGVTQSFDQARIERVSIVFVDAAGLPTTVVLESDYARLRVTSHNDNVDPNQVDNIFLTVRTFYAGDVESVTLVETGEDTGVFEGSIRLAGPWTGSGPGLLETSSSGSPEWLPEVITAEYDVVIPAITATATTVGSRVDFVDEFGRVTSTYPDGGQVIGRVADQNRNDPGTIDTFILTFEAPTASDFESVTFTETGFDTGVFEASIALGPGAGELAAAVGDTVTLSNFNLNDPIPVTATATIVGSAIAFVDEDGELVTSYLEGTRAFVRLADASANSSPAIEEFVSVDLSAELSFDFEALTLVETGPDTGIFEGSIPLSIDPASPQDGTLQTSVFAGPPLELETLRATWTDAGGLTVTAEASTFGSGTAFIDAFGNEVESYATGDTVYVRVEDQNANQLGIWDTVLVTVSSLATGDSEVITLGEVAKSSGIFEGSIELQDSAVPAADGTLQAIDGETVEAVHDDALGVTQSKDQARIERVSIVFIDIAGVPTTVVLESDFARLRVISHNDNVDPGQVDNIFLTVRTFYAGDVESVTLVETGEDTGVFEGSIRLAGPWTGSGPGLLETSSSGSPEWLPEVITAEYDVVIPAITATAATVGSRVDFVDEFGGVTSTYPDGGLVIGRVTDQNRNDPGTIDTFVLTFEAPATSDFESVTFTETGFDTGVFEASIALGPGAGELAAAVGDTVTLSNFNLNDPIPVTATATIVGAAIDFVDAEGNRVAAYLEGSRAFVRITDAAANFSPTGVDSVMVDFSAELSFDFESLFVNETGPDTGIFEGSIPLSIDPANPHDGTLQTSVFAGPPLELETLRASTMSPSGVTVTAEASTFGSGTAFIDAFGNEVESYATGDVVYVRVEDQNANQLGIWDTVLVTVSSLATGDSEVITLGEVAKSSGIFEGSIELRDSAVPASDGRLQAIDGETIEAVHDDSLGVTQSKDQATIERVSIVFVDAAGVPTSVVLESDYARLRVVSHNDNVDPNQVDNIFLTVRTFYAGDVESVTLVETGEDTGIFEGSIRLAGPWTGSGPGLLETSSSGSPEWLPEVITAEYDVVIPAITATATTVGSRVDFVDEFGGVTSTYPDGGQVIGRVTDQNQNDPGTIDTFVLTFEAPASSDFESVTFTETGFDTGVFEASIALGPGAGELAAAVGDTVQLSNFNLNDPIPVTATAAIVGSAIDFVDAAGNRVTSYLESSRAFVRVTDAGANFSPTSPDSISVDLSAELSFDSESLFLTETGDDTGIFEGSMPLSIDPASPQDGTLQTSVFAGPPLELETLRASWTDGTGATMTAEASTFGSTTAFTDAFGNEVTAYGIGETVFVRVEDQNANQLGVVDTVAVDLSSAGDSEPLTLTETSASSGVFEGSMTTSDAAPAALDGQLQVQIGDVIEATHDDSLGVTQSSDQATVERVSVTFVDEAGLPTDEVLEAGFARVRVFSLFDDVSPVAADTIFATLRTFYGGDFESVELTETGSSTRVFEGSIQLAGPFTNSGPGLLDALSSGPPEWLPEVITAEYDIVVPPITATAHTVAARVDLLDLLGQPTASYAQRSTVRVRVEDQNFNNPAELDSMLLTVTSSSGDSETLTLTETGAASGVFEGSVPSTELPTSASDGQLTAASGDTVTASHLHNNDPFSTDATAAVDANFVPTAVDDNATTDTDQAVTIDVLANDSDPELAALSVAAVTQGTTGSVAINPDDTVTYTPNPGTTGQDSFTYVAADPQGGQAQATVTVDVNTPPAVTITAPADGTVITAGDDATFSGTATDAEDGDLTASLSWTSSIDGAIGSGGSFSTSGLSAGVHTVTASVTDSQGVPASDAVTVTINAAPTATITAPADGNVFTQGVSVGFAGTASDPEDGDLAASLAWTSSIDGSIGSGGSFSTAGLSLGTHLITASVTDSQGVPASDSVTITINAAPVVTITEPSDGSLHPQGGAVTFSGSALDVEDGDLGASLTWTSDLDGVIGSGGSFSTSTLSLGLHTVTASVVDSQGAAGAAGVTLEVKVPITVAFTANADDDGWVRESGENTDVGGNLNNTSTGRRSLRVGDNNSDRQYKTIVSFDTSPLPDGATLVSADLRLRRGRLTGTNPFTTHGECRVDVSVAFSGATALELTDFEDAATAAQVAVLSDAPNDLDWSEGTVNAAGLAVVDLLGTTQFRVYFELDDNDDTSNDYMGYYSANNNDSANHPQLVVTYVE